MTTTDTPSTVGAYADVNGLHLYYETQGTGRPLILLHGGLGSGEMVGPVRPALAANHQVITPDLQGHGRTADIDRPIDVRLRHLGLDRPDVVGYSLVVASAHISYDALDQRGDVIGHGSRDVRPAGAGRGRGAEALKGTPMYAGYVRVAPRPEDFPKLLEKIGASMKKPFDFSEEIRGLQVPTMFVAADADMAPPSHYVEALKLLDGGLRNGGWMGEGRPKGGHALAILPGLTQYNLGISPLFSAVTLSFLDAPA